MNFLDNIQKLINESLEDKKYSFRYIDGKLVMSVSKNDEIFYYIISEGMRGNWEKYHISVVDEKIVDNWKFKWDSCSEEEVEEIENFILNL